MAPAEISRCRQARAHDGFIAVRQIDKKLKAQSQKSLKSY